MTDKKKDWTPKLHNGLYKGDLSDEEWREYDWYYDEEDPVKISRQYRIDDPVFVYWRDGGTTHRVVDKEGIAHCVPVPGRMGCVLRWKNKSGEVNW